MREKADYMESKVRAHLDDKNVLKRTFFYFAFLSTDDNIVK